VTLTTTTLADATLNTAYSATLTASGGVPPYTFSWQAVPLCRPDSHFPPPVLSTAPRPSRAARSSPWM
jgi:hypothetical protein